MENKHSSLLNPIRDLAKNWSIDIASELEEYLGDLENIKITLDGGKTTVNFAEAALIIQGSACIYSKKVEYLYTLVFDILNHIIEKKTKKSQQQDENKTNKQSDDDWLNESIDFLPLDDVDEEEDEKIDLPFSDTSKNHLFKPKINFPSNLGYEDHKTRESTNFKLNSCSIHPSGALLLQESDKTLLGQSFNSNTSRMINSSSLNHTNPTNQTNLTINQSVRAVNNGFSTDSDDENDKMGPVLPSKNSTLNSTPTKNTSENSSKTFISDQKNGFRDDDEEQVRPKRTRKQQVEDEEYLIWEPLDPHEESKTKKPFKKKSTSRIPRLPKDSFSLKSEDEIITDDSFTKIKMKGIFHSEFQYIMNFERQRRKLTKKTNAKKQKQIEDEYDDLENDDDFAPIQNDDNFRNEVEHTTRDIGGFDNDDDDDMPVGFDDDNDFEAAFNESSTIQFITNQRALTKPGDSMENNNDLTQYIQTYEDFCKQHLEGYLQSMTSAKEDAKLHKRVQDWQSHIEPKLEEESRKRAYDIEEYGEIVLDSFTTEEMTFDQVTVDKSPVEVCRLFLATLQLANQGNVRIDPTNEFSILKLSNDKMKPKKIIEKYRAPSVHSHEKQLNEVI
eukprot:gene10762-3381_t